MSATTPFHGSEPDPHRVAYLIAGFITETLTEAEHDELDDWVSASDDNLRIFGELTDETKMAAALETFRRFDVKLGYRNLQEKIRRGDAADRRKRWWTFAAVLFAAIAAFSIYQLNISYRVPDNPKPNTLENLQPGSAKATLSTGSLVVDLSTAPEGTVLAGVQKKQSLLTYANDQEPLLAMHTLTTPVGGQYSVTLQDGTRVWLNATSSLQYPSSFTGNERVVQLTGEGYFEVAPDTEGGKKKPFVVQVGDVKVQVTGTRFNVNAYANEPTLTTSLLEGSVTVTNAKGDSIVMQPGNQLACGNGSFQLSNLPNITETADWAQGMFTFHDADIETIMRQLERWYNATVIYKGKVQGHFNASFERSMPISELLHYLELTGRVTFKTEGKNIYVQSQTQ